jgi:hypothetical protein
MPKTPKVALVVAQAYLYTRQPNLGDPREHMHGATLQGLRLVGNKLTAKEDEAHCNEGTHKPRSPRRHNIPRCRSRSRRSRLPSPKNTTKAQGTEEPEDPSLPIRHTTTKMTKKRWEHHALLAKFAPLPYPKDSNYPMISRNTTDLRIHSHGSQIIYKQSKY